MKCVMSLIRFFVLGCLSTVAACGSSGSVVQTPVAASTVQPVVYPDAQSSIGFAPSNAGSLPSDGVTFSQPAVSHLTLDAGVLAESDLPVDIRIDGVGGFGATATVTLNGTESVLPLAPSGNFTDGTMTLALGQDYNGVRIAKLTVGNLPGTISEATGDFSSLAQSTSIFVRGYDVDPTDVLARENFFGNAVFTGEVEVLGLQSDPTSANGVNFGTANGTITLTADFDSDRISGRIDLAATDPSAVLASDEFAVPAVGFDLEDVAINGNAFGGEMTLATGDFGAGTTFRDGAYEGRFYGERIGSIGGTVTGAVDGVGENEILLQGGYVADDPIQTGSRFD